jgi:hypothetical protein
LRRAARRVTAATAAGFGPTLAGVVVRRYSEPADQEAVVGERPRLDAALRGSLAPEQITAVAAYTRANLG